MKNMKNVLLGGFFIFSMTAFGQQDLVLTSSVDKKVSTVSVYKVPEKVAELKKSKESGKKVYSCLTRIVTNIPNEKLKKEKL